MELLNPRFPFDQKVILEEGNDKIATDSAGRGQATMERYGNTAVECTVDSEAEGFMLLLDSYYPGWRAYLDGKQVSILRADYAFRAVKVPAGRHRVEFRYRPASFFIGLGISSIMFIVAAILMMSKSTKPV